MEKVNKIKEPKPNSAAWGFRQYEVYHMNNNLFHEFMLFGVFLCFADFFERLLYVFNRCYSVTAPFVARMSKLILGVFQSLPGTLHFSRYISLSLAMFTPFFASRFLNLAD